MLYHIPHKCPSRGDWRCTSTLYESLTSTHLWSILHAERTRDPSIASSAELGRTLWDNSQTCRCRLHCFISRVRKNSQASSIELGRSLVESDNTPHINSLGANPELIHQVALTTRLLQAHPTVNSFRHPRNPNIPQSTSQYPKWHSYQVLSCSLNHPLAPSHNNRNHSLHQARKTLSQPTPLSAFSADS